MKTENFFNLVSKDKRIWVLTTEHNNLAKFEDKYYWIILVWSDKQLATFYLKNSFPGYQLKHHSFDYFHIFFKKNFLERDKIGIDFDIDRKCDLMDWEIFFERIDPDK